MGYTVDTLAKRPEYDVIPSWFWKQIPTECPYCGLPTEMQLGLTKLTCCNPRCCAKVAKRVEALLNDLGIKGIGEAGVQKFVDEYEVTSPFEIFTLRGVNEDNEPYDYPLYEGVNYKMDAQVKDELENWKKRGLMLWEVAKLMHLPYLGEKSSKKLFLAYNTFEDFYNDKGEGIDAVDFIQSLLGIQGDAQELSLQASNINDSLEEFHDDLLQAEQFYPNIKKVDLDADGHPITGIKGVYTDKRKTDLAKTKKEFYLLIEDTFPDLHVDWESSVTKETDFVITGTGNRTSKLVKAEKYGIPIFQTEEDLIDYLEKLNEGETEAGGEDGSEGESDLDDEMIEL